MEQWKVIGRGFNGWHAERKNCSCEGRYRDDGGDDFAREAVDGALVYDAKNADVNAFSALVIGGPMLDVGLEPDAIDSFSSQDRKAALEMLPLLGDGFKRWALAAQNPKCRSLDKVGVAVYEGLLRQVPGIRFGHVLAGKIVWEDA